MEKLLTIDDFMALGIVPPILRSAIGNGLRAGWIRGYKIGKRWLVNADEVIADLKAKGGNQKPCSMTFLPFNNILSRQVGRKRRIRMV